MPIIDILGVPHNYELITPTAASSDPVLVFIHGWLLSRRYWQPLIESLSAKYPCLIYDLRGFGDSQSVATQEKPPIIPLSQQSHSPVENDKNNTYSSYSLAAYAKDLKILLQKLEIEKAWLIGHSLGGSIALWAADLCGEQIQGVICLNSGGGIYIKEEFERFRNLGQQIIKQRPRWLPLVPMIDWVFARMMVCRPLTSDWGRQRVLDFVKADQTAALGSLLESTTEAEVHFLPQVVSRLQQPVYFLAGSQDKIMESKYIRHLASFHPSFNCHGNNVIEIPNCGHLSMVEQPKIVVDQITEILGRHN
ncbi:alpha/beta hydrolase fold protein [Gloeothece citriformis PCC 7424]|uniref:Alpha/beta hydrolase fold protein n=1 Tax=Gloeothece citriformis (strain PCC 7424) TaxID=65393 RepID=B7K8D2_GLOC7|nr:alpha/beta hydrolase [Gloeothece citriformis]ACK69892.1 alpha/beta hydrolase fold protein [Gloeothece citriformis PCC 7424]